jgi:hypothetical protein
VPQTIEVQHDLTRRTRRRFEEEIDQQRIDLRSVTVDLVILRMRPMVARGSCANSYNDGANVIAERWPPCRQGMPYDAGLFFLAYQKDPRTGFIRIFERMAQLDVMNQFTTHVASALFAIPPGSFIGQALFLAA